MRSARLRKGARDRDRELLARERPRQEVIDPLRQSGLRVIVAGLAVDEDRGGLRRMLPEVVRELGARAVR